MFKNLLAGLQLTPWLTGFAFVIGLTIGGSVAFKVGQWSTGWDAAQAHQDSADCQAGRADANAAAVEAGGDIRKDMTPIVTALNDEVERLETALEQARLEIDNDPRPVCLAGPDDVERMRRLAEGNSDPGDSPSPR